ncbi:MAG: hypothetical protein HC769_33655 [Cyanobacteria bacterium CRU_2_1]|nr:hypothetical protein [Cyanobacteria bacterium CRU_2_1]
MASKKYYAVLKGRQTGIFTSWADCEEQIKGVSGALYKAFKTRGEAEAALGMTDQASIFPTAQNEVKWREVKERIVPASELILESVCVDASCLGNPGDVEYRGIYTATREVIFHKRPMPNGTNNLGEFLAIVHALAHLKNQTSDIPIYSDSETAILWVKNKRVRTKLEPNKDNKEIFNLTERALKWLENNDYTNTILKWNTQSWGEIPADFGRKHGSHNPPQLSPTEQTVRIIIFGNTYPVREQLKKTGLKWNDKTWIGDVSLAEIERLKQFCRQHDLQYTIEGEDFKESRLPRGSRPLPNSNVPAVMGEGMFQWEIEETLGVENLRNKKHRSKKQR